MITRFPHTLFFQLSAGDASEPIRDDDGNYVITPDASKPETSPCRAEPNGSGRMISGTDGSQTFYSWIIYLPKDAVNLGYGSPITVNDSTGKQIAQGNVKLFSQGQLSSRLWV